MGCVTGTSSRTVDLPERSRKRWKARLEKWRKGFFILSTRDLKGTLKGKWFQWAVIGAVWGAGGYNSESGDPSQLAVALAVSLGLSEVDPFRN